MAKEKKTKITITGEEFSDIVAEIIHDYYNRIISDDNVFLSLKLQGPKVNEFSVELSIILTVIAMRLFSVRHHSEVLQGRTVYRILEKNEEDIFKLKNKENEKEKYGELYNEKYNMFLELIPNQKSSYSIRSQWLGFSRYLISQFSSKTEDENKEIITKISTYIVEFGDIVSRLFANSHLKVTSAWTGKYEFVVTK